MNDVKRQMLGSVTPPVVGRKYIPSLENLIVSDPEAVVMEYCTGCGWNIDITLNHLNEQLSDAGFQKETEESLGGKFVQRKTCIMCAESGDEPGFQILDIPRSS